MARADLVGARARGAPRQRAATPRRCHAGRHAASGGARSRRHHPRRRRRAPSRCAGELSALGEVVDDPVRTTAQLQRSTLVAGVVGVARPPAARWPSARASRPRPSTRSVRQLRVLPTTITFLRSSGELQLTISNDLDGAGAAASGCGSWPRIPRLVVSREVSEPLDLPAGFAGQRAGAGARPRERTGRPAGAAAGAVRRAHRRHRARQGARAADRQLGATVGGVVAGLVVVVGLVRALRRPRRRRVA